jgi:hypothetical protein
LRLSQGKIYYSADFPICQQLFSNFLKKFSTGRSVGISNFPQSLFLRKNLAKKASQSSGHRSGRNQLRFLLFKRLSGAALHNSAREDCEENFRQNKAENRRNTLCISRFAGVVMAEICRKTPQMQLCGVALN